MDPSRSGCGRIPTWAGVNPAVFVPEEGKEMR